MSFLLLCNKYQAWHLQIALCSQFCRSAAPCGRVHPLFKVARGLAQGPTGLSAHLEAVAGFGFSSLFHVGCGPDATLAPWSLHSWSGCTSLPVLQASTSFCDQQEGTCFLFLKCECQVRFYLLLFTSKERICSGR